MLSHKLTIFWKNRLADVSENFMTLRKGINQDFLRVPPQLGAQIFLNLSADIRNINHAPSNVIPPIGVKYCKLGILNKIER